MSEKVENLDFEAALNDLQKIVERLESGDTKLEDALKDFEQGVALTRKCQTYLNAASERVEILTQNASGAATLQPFQSSEQ